MISMMKFYPPMNANVAKQFHNYNEKKLQEHFWLSKTIVIYMIDEITVQLCSHL